MKSIVKRLALQLADSTSSDALRRLALKTLKVSYEPSIGEIDMRPLFVFSVDFDVTRKERYTANKQGTQILLNLSEEFNIPLTWAICGFTAEQDRDSLEAILSSPVKHEIAVHTYSHLDLSTCSSEELKSDMEKFKKVVGEQRRYESIVFPWNKEGNFETLREIGFRAYRGGRRRVGSPYIYKGLWNISPVYYVGRAIYTQPELIPFLLDICIKSNSVFHVWTHPWDIVYPSPQKYIENVLKPLFSLASKYKEKGKLGVTTMSTAARLSEALIRSA